MHSIITMHRGNMQLVSVYLMRSCHSSSFRLVVYKIQRLLRSGLFRVWIIKKDSTCHLPSPKKQLVGWVWIPKCPILFYVYKILNYLDTMKHTLNIYPNYPYSMRISIKFAHLIILWCENKYFCILALKSVLNFTHP